VHHRGEGIAVAEGLHLHVHEVTEATARLFQPLLLRLHPRHLPLKRGHLLGPCLPFSADCLDEPALQLGAPLLFEAKRLKFTHQRVTARALLLPRRLLLLGRR